MGRFSEIRLFFWFRGVYVFMGVVLGIVFLCWVIFFVKEIGNKSDDFSQGICRFLV